VALWDWKPSAAAEELFRRPLRVIPPIPMPPGLLFQGRSPCLDRVGPGLQGRERGAQAPQGLLVAQDVLSVVQIKGTEAFERFRASPKLKITSNFETLGDKCTPLAKENTRGSKCWGKLRLLFPDKPRTICSTRIYTLARPK
jgi:hypothetical protein